MDDTRHHNAFSAQMDQQTLDDYAANGYDASGCAEKWGITKASARRRVLTAKRRLGWSMTDPSNDRVNRVQELLDKSSISKDGTRLKYVDVKSWGTAAKVKNADGTETFEEKGLYAVGTRLVPLEDFPRWPVVQRATPGAVQYRPPLPARRDGVEDTLVLGDAQVGYYRDIRTMALTPFHDLAAMDVILQIAASRTWHRVVILGDWLDAQSLSRYLQVAEFQLTMQPSIDFLDHVLKLLRSAVGKACRISYIEGNHERRISSFVATNAAAAYGLRRGGNPEWPQLSVPALLNFDVYGIEYTSAYPGGEVWLAPKLVCQHANPSSRTDLRASIIHGHNERRALETRTIHASTGIETYETWCVPGVGRIDDVSDPTALNRTSVPSDRTRKNANQGLAHVEIDADGRYNITPIKIERGFARFHGVGYQGTTIDFDPMRSAEVA